LSGRVFLGTRDACTGGARQRLPGITATQNLEIADRARRVEADQRVRAERPSDSSVAFDGERAHSGIAVSTRRDLMDHISAALRSARVEHEHTVPTGDSLGGITAKDIRVSFGVQIGSADRVPAEV